MSDVFVQTSIARGLIARMEATHQRRRISVFSGPPGIGKTTALDAWRQRRPGEIAVVKVGWGNARELLVLQHALEALKRLSYDELLDDDLAMFLSANGISDRGAVQAILRTFRGPRSVRSLRRILDLLDDIQDAAQGAPITAEVVGAVLSHV